MRDKNISPTCRFTIDEDGWIRLFDGDMQVSFAPDEIQALRIFLAEGPAESSEPEQTPPGNPPVTNGEASPAVPAPLTWSREKPTQGNAHYHLREKGKYGRTVVYVAEEPEGDPIVTFYNGRRENLGHIRGDSEWAGPIPSPASPSEGA